MKTLHLLILLVSFFVLTTKATNLPLDFETGVYTITNFDGGVLTIIDNPESEGINTSTKVGKMVKNAGENWAGSYITLDEGIDFSLGKIFKMKVYSPKVGTKVLLKIQNSSDATINFEKEVSSTLANAWEELTFNFSAVDATQTYRDVVIIFELGTIGDGSANFTYFLDDISLIKGEEPTTSAPTPPTYDSEKVISIFSDAFTSIDGSNFNPYWGQSTVGSIENLEDGKVLKLADLNYQGIELPNPVNAAAMKYLHIDVWTANETSLDIYPISKTTGEKKANLSPLYLSEWNSFDIKLSDLTSTSFNLADLHQFKFIGAGGHTVFIDNLYFYDDNAEADTEKPIDFEVKIGTITYNSIQLLLNATDNSGAINYFITVNANTTEIGAASGIEKSYEFTRLPSSTEFSYSISAIDPYGNEASNNSIQIAVSTKEALPAPTTSSPTPPALEEAEVISIFSDSYTNIENTNFNPYWQQNTWFISEQIGGNEVLKYENFNYQGIEFGSVVNVSSMTYLHIDLWTPNETYLKVSPISSSTGEKEYNITTIKLNEWNSFDIPLSHYTANGISMTDIGQLKLVGSGKSIIYIDNIYFHAELLAAKESINASSGITCYPNPVNNKLYIASKTGIQNVSVYEISGQLLMSIALNSSNTAIDLSKLNAGYYMVTSTLTNGQQHTQKIVKQ